VRAVGDPHASKAEPLYRRGRHEVGAVAEGHLFLEGELADELFDAVHGG
jgi:hypothetical protein